MAVTKKVVVVWLAGVHPVTAENLMRPADL
mgnify:FL=1